MMSRSSIMTSGVRLCRQLTTSGRVGHNTHREQPINGYYVIYPEFEEEIEHTNKLIGAAKEKTLPPFESVTVQDAQSGAVTAAMNFGGFIGEHSDKFADPKVEATFESVIEPIEERLADVVYVGVTARQQALYQSDNADQLEVQLRANRVAMALANNHNEAYSDINLHRAVREVADSSSLSPWKKRLVDRHLSEGRNNGMELADDERSQLGTTNRLISDFAYTATTNLLQTYSAFNSPIVDPKQLLDAPPHVLSALSPGRSTDPSIYTPGPWSVNLHPSSFWPFMKYCSSRERRENAYSNWRTRATFKQLQKNNSLPLEEMRFHRSLLSETLGYDNYAEMTVSNMMAGSVNTVRAFIDTLRDQLKPTFIAHWEDAQNTATIDDLARTALGTHDLHFYGRHNPLKKHGVNELDIMKHFPMKHVMKELMSTLGEWLHLSFNEVTDDKSIERWHSDVRVFRVHDTKSDTSLGHIFIDPYARDGRRAGWEAVGVRARTEGSTAISYLNCFAFKQNEGDDALLHFDDLRSLCREFGRSLTFMMSASPYTSLMGVNGTPRDCTDAVPLVFEKLLYDPVFLKKLGKETLDSGEAERICNAMRETQLFETYRAVFWADYDIQLHSYKVRTEKFWLDLYRELWAEYFPYACHKHDFTPCTFTPLLSGPLVGCYYSNLWSEMLACDMISHIRESNNGRIEGGFDNFRQSILVEGGAYSMKNSFRNFASTDPSVTPFVEHYQADMAK